MHCLASVKITSKTAVSSLLGVAPTYGTGSQLFEVSHVAWELPGHATLEANAQILGCSHYQLKHLLIGPTHAGSPIVVITGSSDHWVVGKLL